MEVQAKDAAAGLVDGHMGFPKITTASIEVLSTALGLPYVEGLQDWEFELADGGRIGEFLSAYQEMPLTPDDKVALMALLVASIDDALANRGSVPAEWPQVAELLVRERDLHADTILYWECEGETEPDCRFRLTPFIRALPKPVRTPQT